MNVPRRSSGQRFVAYARKNIGYMSRDPSFFWMKTLARFQAVRALARRSDVRALGSGERATDASCLTLTGGIDDALAALDDEGYYVGLRLAPEVIASLRAAAGDAPCYADRDPALPFRVDQRAALEARLGRPVRLASYFDQQETWPAFRALRDDPLLLVIARAYLGREPVHLRSELAWSFPTSSGTLAERTRDAQVFHCDINDYRTLKVFFYLSDVDPGAGPHAYIRRSGRKRTFAHQLAGQRVSAIPEASLVATYGANEVVTVCGPAGTGFLGDPYTLHRGTTPTGTSRLLLQIELGVRRYRTWYFEPPSL
ncbi:hypothetical protein [Sandaracinus amylolyticus]|uniref:hypothetical protein n=1 Tax=Sandaracinus amylolyticus TaxID=927083 RepID=UPI001F461F54|nr:hypothetical protein [Sandaracinus amylolyticus]UJR86965.1 Hypothetical protein I5071_90660 [Sandaracinus amylolyticus]